MKTRKFQTFERFENGSKGIVDAERPCEVFNFQTHGAIRNSAIVHKTLTFDGSESLDYTVTHANTGYAVAGDFTLPQARAFAKWLAFTVEPQTGFLSQTSVADCMKVAKLKQQNGTIAQIILNTAREFRYGDAASLSASA